MLPGKTAGKINVDEYYTLFYQLVNEPNVWEQMFWYLGLIHGNRSLYSIHMSDPN